MAIYHSPRRTPPRTPSVLPDVTVDFAQMSITPDTEITETLEQQVKTKSRRHVDRRHSFAALAPLKSPLASSSSRKFEPSISTNGGRETVHLNVPVASRNVNSKSAEQLQQLGLVTLHSTYGHHQQPHSARSQRDRLTVNNPHHGRSQSVRAPKRPSTIATSSSNSSNWQQHHHRHSPQPGAGGLQSNTVRSRMGSLPVKEKYTANRDDGDQGGDGDDESDADYYLLRHFIVQQHGKGSNRVVNRGDSLRRSFKSTARSRGQQQQSTSQHSSASSISTDNVVGSPPTHQPYSDASHPSASSSRRASLVQCYEPLPGASPSSAGANVADTPLRVLVLGASGVGKTALTAQFMTSEYLNMYEASLDEDSYSRSVSVLLDGEESQLIFIDHPYGEISLENCMSTYNPHAYVIVYSVVVAESLRVAEEILHFIWRQSAERSRLATSSTLLATPPVILVANKIDLVRSRVVSTQAGKSLAVSFDCKYIETSSGMQLNVDELLVGILKQIRLKLKIGTNIETGDALSARSLFRKRSGRRHRGNNNQSSNDPNSSAIGCGYSGLSRRSTSLRMRKMLGKVWPTCADYYHSKSRSCENLHVL